MFAYSLRRLAAFVPTCLLGATAVFLALRYLPGDPALVVLGPTASEAAIRQFRAAVHLDLPLWDQYVLFLRDLVSLRLGRSLIYDRSAGALIADALPYTIDLALSATVISVVVGVPLGVLASCYAGTWIDAVSRFVSLLGASLPIFYTGMIALLLLAVLVPVFPLFGGGDLADPGSRLAHLVLPALSLGLFNLALVTRTTRAAMLDSLGQAYIVTARAKGLPERITLFKHALRNALLPVITVVGVNLNITIGSAILTESVFARPGLGSVIVRAVESRDYEVIQAGLIVVLLIVLVVNLVIDLSYGLTDPRVRLG